MSRDKYIEDLEDQVEQIEHKLNQIIERDQDNIDEFVNDVNMCLRLIINDVERHEKNIHELIQKHELTQSALKVYVTAVKTSVEEGMVRALDRIAVMKMKMSLRKKSL